MPSEITGGQDSPDLIAAVYAAAERVPDNPAIWLRAGPGVGPAARCQ